MPRLLVAALGLMGLSALPAAEPPTPHLSLASTSSVTSARRGSTVSLFLDIVPGARIHVYAPGAKDYLPIELLMTPQPGVTFAKLKYPKSHTLVFKPLTERIPVFDAPFRLVQDVTLGASLQARDVVRLTGVLKYQACDDAVCFNPVSTPVQWTIALK